jgi:hypothetical protein
MPHFYLQAADGQCPETTSANKAFAAERGSSHNWYSLIAPTARVIVARVCEVHVFGQPPRVPVPALPQAAEDPRGSSG